jgi:hypothetical protein
MEFAGTWYARLEERYPEWAPYIAASEAGREDDWGQVDTVPDEVAAELAQPRVYPHIACHPTNAAECYRVAAEEKVEYSADGGQTWEVVWEIPWGRRRLMEYWLQPILCMFCPGKEWGMEIGPYDVTFVDGPEGPQPVVALGTQGLLTRTASGEWQGLNVSNATLAPFYDGNLLLILSELFWSFVAVTVILMALSLWVWRAVLAPRGVGVWTLLVFPTAGLALLGLVLLILALSTYGLLIIIPGVPGLVVVLGFSSLLMWTRVAGLMDNVVPRHGLFHLGLWVLLIIFMVPVLLFYLWEIGLIPNYWIAWTGAIGIGIGAVVWTMRRINRDVIGPAAQLPIVPILIDPSKFQRRSLNNRSDPWW